MAESAAPRPITVAKQSNKRALVMAAIGLGLFLIVFVASHSVAGGNAAKSASDSIKASINTATTQPSKSASAVVLRVHTVSDPGPNPNTTRDPFHHS